MEIDDQSQLLAHYFLEQHAQRFWDEFNTGDLDLKHVPLADLVQEVVGNLHPALLQQCDFEKNEVPSFVLLGFEQVLFLRVKEWFETSQKDARDES